MIKKVLKGGVKMLKHFVLVAAFLLIGSGIIKAADEHWTSLNGPYWVDGIDVAYGVRGLNEQWFRYLVGSNGFERKVLGWPSSESQWAFSLPYPSANKVVSYKEDVNGRFAVFSAHDDDIYVTENGGLSWRRMNFPIEFNQRFKSVEIVNRAPNPGQVVIVGSEFSASQPTVYFTENGGEDWLPLGNNPLNELNVYDIETFPESFEPPDVNIAAGTDDGIYTHFGSWSNPWNRVDDFAGQQAVVLESIDGWDEGKQIAAIIDGEGVTRLYVTIMDHWSTYSEILIGPENEPFDKPVNDISAIYWDGWPGGDALISCYVATDEGLYVLFFDPEQSTEHVEQIDLAYDPTYGYPPFRYDNHINAVDYYHPFTSDDAIIIASTPYGIYEITEQRDHNHNLFDIEVSEIVTGTFLADVTSLAFPSYGYGSCGIPPSGWFFCSFG
jgi:hypothetical protein